MAILAKNKGKYEIRVMQLHESLRPHDAAHTFHMLKWIGAEHLDAVTTTLTDVQKDMRKMLRGHALKSAHVQENIMDLIGPLRSTPSGGAGAGAGADVVMM